MGMFIKKTLSLIFILFVGFGQVPIQARESGWAYLGTAHGCENYIDVNNVTWVSKERVLVWLRSKATPEVEASKAEEYGMNSVTPYIIGQHVFMQVSVPPGGSFETYSTGCTIDLAWKYVQKHHL